MSSISLVRIAAIALLSAAGLPAFAQTTTPTAPASAPATPAATAAKPTAPDSLVLYFGSGSAAIRPQDMPLLDQASRLYRDGHPVTMIVTGGADSVGSPDGNLHLSEMRAQNVLQGLVQRGIPASRFQLLAKGVTDQPVTAPEGTPEAGNRRVEIRWR